MTGVPSAADRKDRPTHRWTFHLTGGRLCLDLANTVSWRRGDQPIERLRTYDNLVVWARQSRLVTDAQAVTLVRESGRSPNAALAALRRVRRLREATYAVFSALAAGERPKPRALAIMNTELRAGVRQLELVRAATGFAVGWTGGGLLLRQILWPVARSVVEVLTSDDLRRLRTCPATNCGWVFLDTTRSGTRRWCDMTVCGNRAKARRYQSRRRGQPRRSRMR